MAAGKKQVRRSRSERLALAAQARRRKQLRTRAAIAIGTAVAVALVAFLIVSGRRDRSRLISRLEAGGCNYDTEADPNSGPEGIHVAPPSYRVDPPSGGNHLPQAAAAGDYSDGAVPPDGQLVHSLEHGYVILWHRPDAGEPVLAALKGVYDKHSRDVLVVPRATLPTAVAATAWHDRLLCSAPDTAALERFVEAFVNKGPEKVTH